MPSPPLSSAERLWRHLVGMFGGDAVERKYGRSVPPEWSSALARIEPRKLDRGMRRLLHSGRDGVPSLPAFVRLCEALGDDYGDGGTTAPQIAADPAMQIDQWGCVANLHLLRHLRRRIGRAHRPYGPPGVFSGAASAELQWCVARLVEAKNAWAKDMREVADANNEVDPEIQRQCWSDYADAAERDISAYMRRAEAA